MNTIQSHVCHLCGHGFTRRYNLQRHIEHMHGEGEPEPEEERDSPESGSENESESQDSETDESEVTEEAENNSQISETSTIEPEDNPAYLEWYDQAIAATEEMRNEKYEKYINEGMDEEAAKEKAHEKVLWAVKRNFFDNYSAFLWHNAYLEEDDIHQDMLSAIAENVQDKGMHVQKAVNRAMAKHKSKLDRLFQYNESDEDEDESEEEMAEEAEESDD